jgi:hypothetical protein
MQISLSPAEFRLATGILGITELPSIPDPHRGWLMSEIEQSMLQATVMLVRAKLATVDGQTLQLSEPLKQFLMQLVHVSNAVVVEVKSNKAVSTMCGFYQTYGVPGGVFVRQSGINMLTLEHIDVNTMVARILAHAGIEETPPATVRPPFQMATLNINRMLEYNKAAKFVARAVDISVWQQEVRMRYRVMYVQNQWWMSQLVGDDYRFEPYQPGYLGWLLTTQCGVVSVV